MADQDSGQAPAPERRRGLLVPSIQRGNAARYAIRAVRLLRAAARQALGIVLAVVIVFEEWGWRPLAAALGWLARFRPIAWIEARIAALPPIAALCVFAAPTLLFLPLKLAAVWLIASGRVLIATALFAFAKVAGTALFARIFQLTQPRLMELAWFARGYNWFLPWKEHLVEQARATGIWQAAHRLRVGFKRAAAEALQRWRPLADAFAARIRGAFGW
ncbi:MAG: hypothetical protein AB7L90_10680 [Hyphomicrobiaceae bacterium]